MSIHLATILPSRKTTLKSLGPILFGATRADFLFVCPKPFLASWW